MSEKTNRAASFALAAVILLFPVFSRAVPALPFPVEMRQPDGTVFEGHLRGDEFAGWTEDGEGRAIVRNRETGFWEYGVLDPEGRRFLPTGRAVNPVVPPADIPKHVILAKDEGKMADFRKVLESVRSERGGLERTAAERDSSSWDPPPLSGERKLLVILVEFADRSFFTTPAEWGTRVFDLQSGEGSVALFYYDNSSGQLLLSPAAHSQTGSPPGVVRVALSTDHPNYGGDGTYTQETAWLNAALAKAASYVNFSSFDANRNGVIETAELTVYFVAAGYETSSGTDYSPDIWAHAWGGTPGITPGSNLYFEHWALQGELNGNSLRVGIGVTAHELGHSLCGLPDLYDKSGTNAGLGVFSLMSQGSWGAVAYQQHGDTPVALDAWSRENLSWGSAMQFPPSGETMQFPKALSQPSTYAKLVNAAVTADEYWLAENRQPYSWDSGLRRFLGSYWSGGMLILHVDNTIKTNEYDPERPQGVMVEEAKSDCSLVLHQDPVCRGAQTNFFYSGNNAAFGPFTVPSSSYHAGSASGVALKEISVPGELMTAVPEGVPPWDDMTVSDLGRAFGGDGGGDGGFCFVSSLAGDGQGGPSRSALPGAFLLLSAFGGAFALLILRKA